MRRILLSLADNLHVPLADDIKGDIKAARKIRLPWRALVCVGIGSLFLSWLFDHLGRLDLAMPMLNSALVLGFAVVVKRNLRRRPWFWGTMAMLAALHIALIVLLPWSTQWVPALAVAAIDSADLIVILAIIAVVGKFIEGTTRPHPNR